MFMHEIQNYHEAAPQQAPASIIDRKTDVGQHATAKFPQSGSGLSSQLVVFETIRQRKHGDFITVSLTISPVKNAEGKIVGASKIAKDITEQKRNQEQIATLAREAEHRSKNLLAPVQATVHLSQSGTSEGLKRAIEGRIQALANVHSLFVDTSWIGAELSTIATRELAPYSEKGKTRVRIDGPKSY